MHTDERMFKIDGKTVYKIKLKRNIFYTGIVLVEDANLIKISTIRGEEKVIAKDEIAESWPIEKKGVSK